MTRSERIELRVTADDKSVIAQAAALEQVTTTEFVRAAVLDRVRYISARADRTLMPAEQFDSLIAALDAPDDVPALAGAFAREPRFAQR